MPKCVVCDKYLPPSYTKILKEDGTDSPPQKCIFCERGISEVEIEVSDGKWQKYTKKQCMKDYQIYLKKLKEKITAKTAKIIMD